MGSRLGQDKRNVDGLAGVVFVLVIDRERDIDDARLGTTFDWTEDRRLRPPFDGGEAKGPGRRTVIEEGGLLTSLDRLFMRQGNPECVLLPALG